MPRNPLQTEQVGNEAALPPGKAERQDFPDQPLCVATDGETC